MKENRFIIIYICETLGSGLFLYTVNNIISDGIYADVHATSGGITFIDIASLLVSLTFQLIAIGIFWNIVKANASRSKSNFAYRKMMYFTFLAMIFAGPCMIIVPLVPLFLLAATALGLMAVLSSYDRHNEKNDHVIACRIINSITLISMLIGVALSLMRT